MAGTRDISGESTSSFDLLGRFGPKSAVKREKVKGPSGETLFVYIETAGQLPRTGPRSGGRIALAPDTAPGAAPGRIAETGRRDALWRLQCGTNLVAHDLATQM